VPVIGSVSWGDTRYCLGGGAEGGKSALKRRGELGRGGVMFPHGEAGLGFILRGNGEQLITKSEISRWEHESAGRAIGGGARKGPNERRKDSQPTGKKPKKKLRKA